MKKAMFLFGVFLSAVVLAQNHWTFFKTMPLIGKDTPEWANKMYSANPNVFEVDRLYSLYYASHSFSKTVHTQNYKHWRRLIDRYINNEGFIKIPTRKEEDAAIQAVRQQREHLGEQARASWACLGPAEVYSPGSGKKISCQANVYALDQSISNPNVLFAGTEAGGIFKSTDKGLNWTALAQDLPIKNTVGAIKIHPGDANIVYASANKRIYRTTNGGSSWSEIFYSGANEGYEIKFHPGDVNTIFLAADNGLFRTTNGGANWTALFTTACWDIDFAPGGTSITYLVKSNPTAKKSEFFVSTDKGNTWTQKTTGWYSPSDINNAVEYGAKIAVSAVSANTVYVGLIGDSKAQDNGWLALYRSTDQGNTWTNPSGQVGGPYQVPNTMPWNVAAYSGGYQQGFFNFDVEVSDKDVNKIWIGTIRLSESTDGGKTFKAIGAADSIRLSDIHADIQNIEVNGDDIWIASDGGVNYSNDELQSHTSRKSGIYAAEFWGFGTGWNEDVLVGGTYHNGNKAWRQNYATREFIQSGGTEEATGYVNPLENWRTYFSRWWTNGISVFLLPAAISQALQEAAQLPILINESYGISNSSGLYFHPNFSDQQFCGYQSQLLKSIDGGATFSLIKDFGSNATVLEMDITHTNPNMMYCVVSTGARSIYKSTDGGSNWAKITDIPASNRNGLEITVNPENGNELWVAAVYGSNGNKIYRSLDGGTSWENKSTAVLDNETPRDILFQGGTNAVVYVATLHGVYCWNAAAGNWINYSSGLPLIIDALSLKPFYRDGKLRLATRGRGIWECPFAEVFRPLAAAQTKTNLSINLSAQVQFDCHSIVNHSGASWLWEFSPAVSSVSSAIARNPLVVFGNQGSYDVSLTVTANGQSDKRTIKMMIGNPAPLVIGASDIYLSNTTANSRRAMPVTMPANGNVVSISMYHETAAPGVRLIYALYDGTTTTPGNRLAVTAETTAASAAGWQRADLLTPYAATTNQKLWLAWNYSANPGVRFQSGTPSGVDSTGAWANGMPAAWGSVANNTANKYSIYASYAVQPVNSKEILAASFAGAGLWAWDANLTANQWSQWNTNDPVQLAAGDCDGNGREDVIGCYNVGLWIRLDSGAWQQVTGVGTPVCLSAGDFDGDGKDDLIGVWTGLGVWARYSGSNVWTQLHNKDASKIACGDFDKDGKDDLLGVWNPEGTWIKYASGTWSKILDAANLVGITTGDMNGDGRDDVLGNWTVGVWYKDIASGSWTKIHGSAEQIAAGNLDGCGADDLIGEWAGVAGIWTRYATGAWIKIHDNKPVCFVAGKLK